jgi:4-hydroxy-tetrahydrodipicolinate synthase
MITPLNDDDTLNLEALRDHIDFLIAGGVHGLIPAGSTGEAMSLLPDEWRAVIQTTVEQTRGRVPVIAGCSANATKQVIANCRQARQLGADGALLVHPYYSLPDPRELDQHYRAVSASVDFPIIIYNNPFTTGVDSKPDLLAGLAGLPHLEYVKESSGDIARVLQILRLSKGRFGVLVGSDNQALEAFLAGATGWVAGAANALPSQCADIYRLSVEEGRFAEALAVYKQIYEYLTLSELTGKFVQVNKAAVNMQGRRAGPPRPPLLPLDDALHAEVATALEQAFVQLVAS